MDFTTSIFVFESIWVDYPVDSLSLFIEINPLLGVFINDINMPPDFGLPMDKRERYRNVYIQGESTKFTHFFIAFYL